MQKAQLLAISFLISLILFDRALSLNELTNYEKLNKFLFTYAYKHNSWADQSSRSGTGSNLIQTSLIRIHIPQLLKQIGAKTLLDAPYGDFYWMKKVDLSFLDQYIGIDIVTELIEKNKAQYSSSTTKFYNLDIITDLLPQVDVILCRDCLQHLPDENIFEVIKNFKKSKSTYLLVSHYINHPKNEDIQENELFNVCRMRRINLELPPFNFPKPLAMIDEGFNGKTLSLWQIRDLPDYP